MGRRIDPPSGIAVCHNNAYMGFFDALGEINRVPTCELGHHVATRAARHGDVPGPGFAAGASGEFDDGEFDDDREFAPVSGIRLNVDLPVHQVHDLANNREPKAAPAVLPGSRSFDLLERIKDGRNTMLRDPDAGVGNFKPELPAIRRNAAPNGPHGDAAFVCKFQGVGQQVHKDLPEAERVADAGSRYVRSNETIKRQASLANRRSKQLNCVIDKVG